MSNQIKRITIVGGGTAGWLTALLLNAYLNKSDRNAIRITLIESPNIPTIGVGESTIQNLKSTLSFVGIDESDFIAKCNASFKMGVQFIDWSRTDGVTASRFFHPLNNPAACGGLSPAYHFRKFGAPWMGASFGESILPNAAVIAAKMGPRTLSQPDYFWEINYAYHLDAGLFANYMRDFAVSKGVEHVRDDVSDVFLDESGAVEALQLAERGRYPLEFVIDCTGFRSLIRGRLQGEPFFSASDRLLNDRAIPVQLPHPDPTKLEPCTRAVALGAGWVWRVPLYSRVGTGYVYSSAFRSDDEARAEFLTYLRSSGDFPADAVLPETRVIPIRVGYQRQPWVKNCVAIGLSGGFVEPLEATAIFAIDAAAHRLVMNFPDKDCNPVLANAYNERATALMEEIVDFLHLNYLSSNRNEPYWQAVREETKPSDWLRDKMELWKRRLPDMNDTHKNTLFDFSNFIYLLYPKGYFGRRRSPLDNFIREEDWKSYCRDVKTKTASLIKTLPSHYELLTAIRSRGASQKTTQPIPLTLGKMSAPPSFEQKWK